MPPTKPPPPAKPPMLEFAERELLGDPLSRRNWLRYGDALGDAKLEPTDTSARKAAAALVRQAHRAAISCSVYQGGSAETLLLTLCRPEIARAAWRWRNAAAAHGFGIDELRARGQSRVLPVARTWLDPNDRSNVQRCDWLKAARERLQHLVRDAAEMTGLSEAEYKKNCEAKIRGRARAQTAAARNLRGVASLDAQIPGGHTLGEVLVGPFDNLARVELRSVYATVIAELGDLGVPGNDIVAALDKGDHFALKRIQKIVNKNSQFAAKWRELLAA